MKLGKWKATPGSDLEDCGMGQTFLYPAVETHFLVRQTDRRKEKRARGIHPRGRPGPLDPAVTA